MKSKMKNLKFYEGVILHTMAGVIYAICAVLCFLSNQLVAGIINTVTSTMWLTSGLIFEVKFAQTDKEIDRFIKRNRESR